MIRRNATFRARLERLERKQRRDPLPRIFLAICPQDNPGPIVGFKAGNLYVEREVGESETSLRERAAVTTGALFLIAAYAERPLSAAERAHSRSASPAPVEPSGTLSGSEIDLGGIGRKATADELWHAGWTRGPAERPR